MEVSLNQDVISRLQEVWAEIGLDEAERVRRVEALREQVIRVYVDTLESAADERDTLENELDAAEALLLELQAEVAAAQKSAPAAWLPADVLSSSRRTAGGDMTERQWGAASAANNTIELSTTFGAGGLGHTAAPDMSVSCTLPDEPSLQREAPTVERLLPGASTNPGLAPHERSGRTGDSSGRQGTLLQCLDEVSRQVAALEAQKRLFVERLGELQKRVLTLWVDELGEVVDDLPEEYRDALVITGSRRTRDVPSAVELGANVSPSHEANFTQITTIASDLNNPLRKISIREYGQRIRALESKISELLELRQQRVQTIASLLVSIRGLLRRLCIVSPEETESELDRLALTFDGTQEPLGASLVSIDVLTARVAYLEREIELRVEELDRVSNIAAELYKALRYPAERFSAFQAEHSTLSKHSLEAWHSHVEELRATREKRLRALIAKEKERLTALWNELDIAPAQRVSFAFCSNDEASEEVLEAIEQETSRLESIARRIRPIHELLRRREELLEKKMELDREMQNPERLFGRSGGKRIVGGLLREEQLRKQVRQLPKVNNVLRSLLESYAHEFQKRFIHKGVDILERLQQEEAAEAAMRVSRSGQRETPTNANSGAFVPVATVPANAASAAGSAGRLAAPSNATSARSTPTPRPNAPNTWNGTSAKKVLAAQVRKRVESKQDANTPFAVIGQAKTTTALAAASAEVPGAWCAWLSAAGPANQHHAMAREGSAAPYSMSCRAPMIGDLRMPQFASKVADSPQSPGVAGIRPPGGCANQSTGQNDRCFTENASSSSGTEMSTSNSHGCVQGGSVSERSTRTLDRSPAQTTPTERAGAKLAEHSYGPSAAAPSFVGVEYRSTPTGNSARLVGSLHSSQSDGHHSGGSAPSLRCASEAKLLDPSLSSGTSVSGSTLSPCRQSQGTEHQQQQQQLMEAGMQTHEHNAPALDTTSRASHIETPSRLSQEKKRALQTSDPESDQENSSLQANVAAEQSFRPVETPRAIKGVSDRGSPRLQESDLTMNCMPKKRVRSASSASSASTCTPNTTKMKCTAVDNQECTTGMPSNAPTRAHSCAEDSLSEQPGSTHSSTRPPAASGEPYPVQFSADFPCAESPIR